MNLAQPPSMTVLGLYVDSFKRIQVAHIKPNATGIVRVCGDNKQGKSSLIQSMKAALCGKGAMPELPITIGSHGSQVVVDLGEIVVKRKWKRNSAGEAESVLTVESAQGAVFKSPQAVLDNLVGRFADPVAFLSMKPQDQVKTILSVLGLDSKLNELEGIAQGCFEKRRDLGRDLERVKQASAVLDAEVEALGPAPEIEHDAKTLMAHLQSANEHNQRIADAERTRLSAAEIGASIANDIASKQEQIKRLQLEIDALNERVAVERKKWVDANEYCEQTKRIDTTGISNALKDIERLQRDQSRRELAKLKRDDLELAEAAYAGAEEQLEAARSNIKKLLETTPFPIPGMTYDADDKLLKINGVPFSEASDAESIEVAAAVAMAGNPPIKVMFARNGSMLGPKAQMRLAEICEQMGWQLWMEIVTDSPDGAGIWIEEGHAYGPLSDEQLPSKS